MSEKLSVICYFCLLRKHEIENVNLKFHLRVEILKISLKYYEICKLFLENLFLKFQSLKQSLWPEISMIIWIMHQLEGINGQLNKEWGERKKKA